MITLVKLSFKKAYRTIANNLVLFWFPPLFGAAMVVLLMLFADLLLRALPTQSAQTTLAEMLPLAVTTFALVLGTASVFAATTSGTMYLQGQAARGEFVDTSHFLQGVRLLFVKVLTGSIFVYLWYTLILVGFGWPVFETIGRLMAMGIPLAELPTAEVEAILMTHGSRVALGGATALLSAVMLSMWTRVLALGQESLGQAMVHGLRFALMNIVIIGPIFVLHWGVPLVVQQYLSEIFWPVAVLTHAISVYGSVALMHFYIAKTDPEIH